MSGAGGRGVERAQGRYGLAVACMAGWPGRCLAPLMLAPLGTSALSSGRQCLMFLLRRRACTPIGSACWLPYAALPAPAPGRRYAATACPARFELLNAYIPGSKWLGAFDRVHVGASVPPDRLAPLLALLKPEVRPGTPGCRAAYNPSHDPGHASGCLSVLLAPWELRLGLACPCLEPGWHPCTAQGGLMVAPVNPNDLRVITRRPNGGVSQRARCGGCPPRQRRVAVPL